MTNTPSTDNIRAAYNAASEQDIADGMAWYDSANALARSLTPEDHSKGAAIIAALSPLTAWPLNVKRATELVSTGETKGLKRNVAKAQAILAGGVPLDILGGDKVRSFYMNIMGINSAEAVTIDRHAIDAAVGRTLTDSERAALAGKRSYRAIAKMYVDVAADYGITGAQLQAIVWVYWRRNRAQAFHGD